MKTSIYVVDDEPNILELIRIALSEAGYAVTCFNSSKEFLQAVTRKTPDAVVLDIMMPAPDGLAVCSMLRGSAKTRTLPILMLTARNDELDRVLGLELGADDYLTKPFSIKELCARVKALIRRANYAAMPEDGIIESGVLTVNTGARQAFLDGAEMTLTLKEFDLLSLLLRNRGRVMTRDIMLDQVWGTDFYGDTRTVDVHIRYLRQKLGEHSYMIQTVRGVGYRFTDSV